MRIVSLASTVTVTLALTACSAAGNAPAVSTQAGASAQSAGFVPQSAAIAAAPAGTTARLDRPLPEPLIALGNAAVSRDITSPIINDSGAYTNGAIIVGTDTVNGYGVEGVTKGSGAGLYGHSGSSSATSYGVYGFSSGGAGVYGYDSNAGDGVLGVSTKGNGVQGETSFPSNGSFDLQKAGVLGEDLSTDGGFWNAGVAGISNSGSGLYGSSSSDDGVYGYSGTGTGVYGVTENGYAVEAEAAGSGAALYASVPYGSNAAIIAQSGGISLLAENDTPEATMSLDSGGNMILLGNLTVDGTISSSSTTKPDVSSPGLGRQIESVGGAQLAGGSTHVTIDAGFAQQLDPAKPYRVFLTPDGDSKGLYVSDKSATGFAVHENQGGKSSLAFDYRIVGTPRQVELQRPTAPRLPAARLKRPAF